MDTFAFGGRLRKSLHAVRITRIGVGEPSNFNKANEEVEHECIHYTFREFKGITRP
jgi:hypothetical protein